MTENKTRIARLELILQVFIELDQQFIKADSLFNYMKAIHPLLSSLMYAENFYLALYHSKKDQVQFVYSVDEIDGSVDPDILLPLTAAENSPTAWVIRKKTKLIMTKQEHLEKALQFGHWGEGAVPHHWMGMPLISHLGECLGALVIQSYNEKYSYSLEDEHLFKLFSSVVTSAISKHHVVTSLNEVIEARTKALEQELSQRAYADKLQHALFKIASFTMEELELDELYSKIHHVIGELIYAKNLAIILYDQHEHTISFPYFIDEYDGNSLKGVTIPLGEGLSSYVIKTRKPQKLTIAQIEKLIAEGEIKNCLGSQNFTSWLGAPMISSNSLHGIIIVQSYHEDIIYSDRDLEILHFVANQVASAIEITINSQERKKAQNKLAQHHELLANQNIQLSKTVDELKSTQKELIQKEKMASLGGLVAGIAHEINTPLGVCVTGVSHLLEENKLLRAAYQNNQLTKTMLIDFIDAIDETGTILTANTQRAASLIHSFKQIAVDQSSENVREINLPHYIQEIILSLRPILKKTQHQVLINCQQNLQAKLNAGAISQIVSNLIVNSITHGFEHIEKGIINIDVFNENKHIHLIYQDNGVGMSEDSLAKLFEPFYTTKRSEGGSGLGAHLIFNLVTTALNGSISVSSNLNQGLKYTIIMPNLESD